jgi:hypothetical protein
MELKNYSHRQSKSNLAKGQHQLLLSPSSKSLEVLISFWLCRVCLKADRIFNYLILHQSLDFRGFLLFYILSELATSQLLLFVCTVWSIESISDSRSPSKFTFSFDNKTIRAFQRSQLWADVNRVQIVWCLNEWLNAVLPAGKRFHWMKLGDEYVSTLHYQSRFMW